MAVNSDGAVASAGGGGTLTPMLANWVSSGVHVSVKSYRPVRPVRSTTGRSRTAVCITVAKSVIETLIAGNDPSPRKNRLGSPLGSPELFVSVGPLGPRTNA